MVFLKHIFFKKEEQEKKDSIEKERLINLILSISTKKFLVSWSREVSSKKLARVSVS